MWKAVKKAQNEADFKDGKEVCFLDAKSDLAGMQTKIGNYRKDEVCLAGNEPMHPRL